jgi:hypothetical protein
MKTTLLKPFEKYNENQLLFFGILFLIIGSFISSFCHSNYDGYFDLHFSNYELSFTELLIQNGINVAVLFLCFFLAGIYRNKKTRPIDMLNTVLIARVPFYFLSLFNINHASNIDSTMPINELTEFALDNLFLLISMTIVMILVIVWMFALLYNGYKTATNAKGNTAIALFVVALIVAEVLSKFIIYQTILKV